MNSSQSPRTRIHVSRGLIALVAAVSYWFSNASAAPIVQQAYLKASTAGVGFFGAHVALSGDTAVVSSPYEPSNATGVNGNESDTNATRSGAAYVFVRNGTDWTQQAYLKPSNTGSNDQFGSCVAISGDTIVIGAPYEDSNAAGVNGNGGNNSAPDSGAAYVFVRNGTQWTQQAYLKASNPGADDYFGWSVAISGNTIVVGAFFEDSGSSQQAGFTQDSGAAYVFVRDGTNWSQQAFLKSPRIDIADYFGQAVAVSGDTIIVSAGGEDSRATGVNGNQNDNSASSSGAAYVFTRSETNWSLQAYLKASNTEVNDTFGFSVALSGDTAVVGSFEEASSATGVSGDQTDNSSPESGAAYVFARDGTNWTQQAYLKASNTRTRNYFGRSVGVSGDSVVVGAMQESSHATGVNGDQTNFGLTAQGAAYVFVRAGTNWHQQAYLKASNPGGDDFFGGSVSISGDTVLIGASGEGSGATGVNGNQNDESRRGSGAAYVLTGICPACPQLALTRDGSGGYFIHFDGAPDSTYVLQRAPSVTGTWDTLATLTAPASGHIEHHDAPPLSGQAFYRTVQP